LDRDALVSEPVGPSPSSIERISFLCFLVAAGCAIGLAFVYGFGGQPQAEGILLGISLLAFGTGLVLWAHALMPKGPFVEQRHSLATTDEQRELFEQALEREGSLTRRRLLIGGMTGALVALGVAFLFPIRSLGPNPGNSLLRTPWRKGKRAVTSDGRPVRAQDVPLDGLVTIFPDGHTDSADGQVVLMRVDPDRLDLPKGRGTWTPEGLIAYSKVCTHAGCPVGLYEAQRAQLLCPCHQSAFDVLTGANPVFGPAARALPQLPLAIDDAGYIVSQSDFHEPVGPTFWNRK
jgi:ubiquinol-cytochrome c reductase iron-sulfur subunit